MKNRLLPYLLQRMCPDFRVVFAIVACTTGIRRLPDFILQNFFRNFFFYPGQLLCKSLRVRRKLRIREQLNIPRLLLLPECFVGVRDILCADDADRLRGYELIRDLRLFVVPFLAGINPAGFSGIELFQRVRKRFFKIQLPLPGLAVCVFIVPDEVKQRHGAQGRQADLCRLVKERRFSRFEALQPACRRSVIVCHAVTPFKKKPRTGVVRGFHNKITVLRRRSTSCGPCPYART